MDASTTEHFKCPICRDILRTPIRITQCGHNFCQVCLEGLLSFSSAPQKRRCPICRTELNVFQNGARGLIRNRLLEDAIPKIMVQEPSVIALEHFKNAVSSYLRDLKFEEALKIVEAVIIQETAEGKIIPLLHKVRCQKELGFLPESRETKLQLISLLNSVTSRADRLKIRHDIEDVVTTSVSLKMLKTFEDCFHKKIDLR